MQQVQDNKEIVISDQSSQFRFMPKFLCSKKQRHQEINTVCLDQSCIQKDDFLLCLICSTNQHKDHEQIPIKLLINEISLACKKYSNEEQQQLINAKQIEKGRQKVMNKLEQIRKQFEEKMQIMTKSAQTIFDQLTNYQFYQKNYNFKKQECELLLKQMNEFNSQAEVNQTLKNMLSQICVDQNQRDLIKQANENSKFEELQLNQNKLFRLIDSFQQDLTTIFEKQVSTLQDLEAFTRFNNSSEQQQQQQQQQQSQNNSIQQLQLSFSPEFKHSQINVIHNKVVNLPYKESTKYVYRVCTLQPSLEQSSKKIIQWTCRIAEAVPNWIGFGMCHLNNLQKKKFQFEKNEFALHQKSNYAHECYFITSHGWGFANLRQPVRMPFMMKKGDSVTIKFDPFMNCLVFYKNNEFLNPFNMDFNYIIWNKLYPCIILWYPNDAVEIINM